MFAFEYAFTLGVTRSLVDEPHQVIQSNTYKLSLGDSGVSVSKTLSDILVPLDHDCTDSLLLPVQEEGSSRLACQPVPGNILPAG